VFLERAELCVVALLAGACGSATPGAGGGTEALAARSASESQARASADTATHGDTPKESAPATEPTATVPPPEESRPTFPPPQIPPPSAKSAAEGDGTWTPFGTAALGERGANAHFIVRTVLHPHPSSRFVTVTIAAADLTRLTVRFVPGTEDMLWAKRPSGEPSGLVPAPDRDRLVAVMNGGFQPKHGRWGMRAGSVSITPPREDGCTLALYRDGSVRLAPWPKLASTETDMESIRQTPPCILEEGSVHPALLRGDDKRWAGHAADLQTRRRSAVGLSANGQVLFYAMGEEASPRYLAEALRLAGAANAAQLDINWYWTRFLLFGTPNGEPLQITSTLIPKMEHLKRGYVERPSTRDFFYFVERR
jgi:hypothetical protein